jgi:hypothetical protein
MSLTKRLVTSRKEGRSPMRRHRDQTFRKADATRGLLAAESAGMKDPCLVIDSARKKAMIVPGELLLKNGALPNEPPKDGVVPEADPTPLEQWRAKRSGQG